MAKHSSGKTLSFRGFSLNCKCFPTNYGLVNWQCKSTSMQAQKFSCKCGKFCTPAVKVFPLEGFAIYSNAWFLQYIKDVTKTVQSRAAIFSCCKLLFKISECLIAMYVAML